MSSTKDIIKYQIRLLNEK
jgi:hypothetical protein